MLLKNDCITVQIIKSIIRLQKSLFKSELLNPNYWKGHYNWPTLVVIDNLDTVLYLRNVGYYSSTMLLTLPITGNSTDPHVSANQWTRPDAKSADIIPQKAATMIVGIFFRCIW